MIVMKKVIALAVFTLVSGSAILAQAGEGHGKGMMHDKGMGNMMMDENQRKEMHEKMRPRMHKAMMDSCMEVSGMNKDKCQEMQGMMHEHMKNMQDEHDHGMMKKRNMSSHNNSDAHKH